MNDFIMLQYQYHLNGSLNQMIPVLGQVTPEKKLLYEIAIQFTDDE